MEQQVITRGVCCEQDTRLIATRGVPREVYERTCPRCGSTWTIARTMVVELDDVRLDKLEWTHRRLNACAHTDVLTRQ